MTMTPAPPRRQLPPGPRVQPRDGRLYVCRWLRRDGREARQKFYRRQADADAFAARLRASGRHVEVWQTEATWSPA